MTRSKGRRANRRSSPTSDVHSQQLVYSQELLPGLPDFLTVEHISTRIPWQSVKTLSRVSRRWRHEIRTREVHRARVRAHSTEEFVVVCYNLLPRIRLCLYSMRYNLWLELPPPPLPGKCKCVALDGRLYVMGTPNKFLHRAREPGKHDMSVLDLAGQRKWKRCSSMNETRTYFGCGTLHDKIYVFGGIDDDKCVPGSEVYDPEKDIWSPMSPMITFRFRHRIETVGEEFFAHGGEFARENPFRTRDNVLHYEKADFYEVFNPSTDEWRVVTPDLDRLLFTARGKLYAVSRGMRIDVLDAEGNSTAMLQSDSEPIFGRNLSPEYPCAVLAVENELLAILCVHKIYQPQLVRSRRFGDGSGKIVWEKVLLPPRSRPDRSYPWQLDEGVLCTIRL